MVDVRTGLFKSNKDRMKRRESAQKPNSYTETVKGPKSQRCHFRIPLVVLVTITLNFVLFLLVFKGEGLHLRNVKSYPRKFP